MRKMKTEVASGGKVFWNGEPLWTGTPIKGRQVYYAPFDEETFISQGVSTVDGREQLVFDRLYVREEDLKRFIAAMKKEKAKVKKCDGLPYDGTGTVNTDPTGPKG
jgi:hypothetical protein